LATYVGIDVGHSAVKVAKIHVQFKRIRLLAMAQADIGPEGEGAAIRYALERVKTAQNTSVDGTAAALDGTRGTIRMLDLPISAQKQVAEVLPFELESDLPFALDEAVWDYRLKPGTRNEGKTFQVLTAVAKTQEVKRTVDALKEATGLEPERVSLGPFPLANLAPYVAADTVYVVVDIGLRRSEVLLMMGETCLGARTLGTGTVGLPAAAQKLARELRTSLAHFASTGLPAPTKVLLAGGGAFVLGAQAYLASELAIVVEPIRIAQGIEIDPTMPAEVMSAMPNFAKALGLALSLGNKPLDVNLRQGGLAFERGFAWLKEKTPMLLALLGAAIFFASFAALVEMVVLARERATLEKALSTVTKDVLGKETSEASEASALLSQSNAAADEDPLPHADAFDVMVRLSESIPASVMHDIEELDYQKGHARMNGIIPSVNDAQELVTSLKSDRCFSDVKLVSTTQAVGQDNANRKKYIVEFDVKCPEDQKTKKKRGLPRRVPLPALRLQELSHEPLRRRLCAVGGSLGSSFAYGKNRACRFACDDRDWAAALGVGQALGERRTTRCAA
jgi:general secretion pathway protein L